MDSVTCQMEDNQPPPLNALKHERVRYLKEMKQLANQLLEENKDADGWKASWEKDVVKNNILQLKELIRQLNNDLHPLNVERYASHKLAMLTEFPDPHSLQHYMNLSIQKIKEDGFKFDLSRFSLSYSLIHDLYWINDGFVGEHLDIALGVIPPESLEVYFNDKLKLIKNEAIPFFSVNPSYMAAAPMLAEVIENIEQNSYLTTNILMPVVIESITRELATWVYKQQNPNMDVEGASSYVAGFMSLENLILKGDWKEDIPMNFYSAVLESKYINDPKLSWAAQTLKDWEIAKGTLSTLSGEIINVLNDQSITDDEKQQVALALTNKARNLILPFNGVDRNPIYVTLKVKLQFLIRRFKEDRNAIIHGHFQELNKKWKCYVNFSALFNIYKLILELEALYKRSEKDSPELT